MNTEEQIEAGLAAGPVQIFTYSTDIMFVCGVWFRKTWCFLKERENEGVQESAEKVITDFVRNYLKNRTVGADDLDGSFDIDTIDLNKYRIENGGSTGSIPLHFEEYEHFGADIKKSTAMLERAR